MEAYTVIIDGQVFVLEYKAFLDGYFFLPDKRVFVITDINPQNHIVEARELLTVYELAELVGFTQAKEK